MSARACGFESHPRHDFGGKTAREARASALNNGDIQMGDGERETLTIRDNRTGKEYEVDILEGDVVRSMDLRQIKVNDDDFGMMAYDPAFKNIPLFVGLGLILGLMHQSVYIQTTQHVDSPSDQNRDPGKLYYHCEE